LPQPLGFDYHLGFLKGGEDHFHQNHCAGGPTADRVDLWENHGPARGKNGTYSAYLYADAAVEAIHNFTAELRAFRAMHNQDTVESEVDPKLFMYLPWHDTHDPLEAPPQYKYPSLPAYKNSFGKRMQYNAMARALDEGMNNVTAALTTANLWDEVSRSFSDVTISFSDVVSRSHPISLMILCHWLYFSTYFQFWYVHTVPTRLS
jgi:hypothetical protein